MARSAERGMAMPSTGRRAVAGAFTFDHGRGCGHSATVRSTEPKRRGVTLPGGSANDQGAIAPRREAHDAWRNGRNDRNGIQRCREATSANRRCHSQNGEPWRAADTTPVGGASERRGEAAHAASRTRSGDRRVGSSGERERARRWRVAPSRVARDRAGSKKGEEPIPAVTGSAHMLEASGASSADGHHRNS